MYEVRACLTPSSKPDPVVGRSCQKKERHPNQNAIYFPPDAPSRFHRSPRQTTTTTTNHRRSRSAFTTHKPVKFLVASFSVRDVALGLGDSAVWESPAWRQYRGAYFPITTFRLCDCPYSS